jgi:hypothetical protein
MVKSQTNATSTALILIWACLGVIHAPGKQKENVCA